MKDVTPPVWTDDIQLDYPLDSNSIIVDAGMYEGGWAARIIAKFNCRLVGLEPVKSFYDNCVKRFSGNDKVQVLNYGLAPAPTTAVIFVNKDASSRFIAGGKDEVAEFIPLADVMTMAGIDSVDLLKINIEGAEYAVMENILAADLAAKIKFLQVQYHDGAEYAPERLENIRNGLTKTHDCLWRWSPMIWESWGRKDLQ